MGDKLVSQMDLEKLLDQMKESDFVDKLSENLGTHPYTLNRISCLSNFYSSKIYASIPTL